MLTGNFIGSFIILGGNSFVKVINGCFLLCYYVNKARKRQQEHRRIRTLSVDRGDTLEMLRDHIDSNQVTSHDDSVPLFGLNRHRAWQIIRDCAGRTDLPDLVNPETDRVRGVSSHRLRDAFSVHVMKLDDTGDALRLLQEQFGSRQLQYHSQVSKGCRRRASQVV
ncbi:hypothetical protein ACFLVK_00850 [Chloroflexota bacterium]